MATLKNISITNLENLQDVDFAPVCNVCIDAPVCAGVEDKNEGTGKRYKRMS